VSYFLFTGVVLTNTFYIEVYVANFCEGIHENFIPTVYKSSVQWG